ncbi:MAG: hypothetical protein ACI8ZB_002782 [Desulforhopalus sp.]|jgi:uncharacterized protein YecE (DUF72 family)
MKEVKNSPHIGTCSWKYDSWRGIVYSDLKEKNFLREYSQHFSTVEVDQWFWSLFVGDKVVLPNPKVVQEYADSVPEDFIFSIKVPNSITLTHHYKKQKGDALMVNPHFLSVGVMNRFLELLEPLGDRIGPLNFQFEYLNKQKMGGVGEFVKKFGEFIAQLSSEFKYCIEIRNPNYLTKNYFDFIAETDLHHVFLHGYYMPFIFDVYKQFGEKISSLTVIRLHGEDRKKIEEKTGNDWSEIVAPKDGDLQSLAAMLAELSVRNIETFLYVNNHFEGSAPRTIAKINELLK